MWWGRGSLCHYVVRVIVYSDIFVSHSHIRPYRRAIDRGREPAFSGQTSGTGRCTARHIHSLLKRRLHVLHLPQLPSPPPQTRRHQLLNQPISRAALFTRKLWSHPLTPLPRLIVVVPCGARSARSPTAQRTTEIPACSGGVKTLSFVFSLFSSNSQTRGNTLTCKTGSSIKNIHHFNYSFLNVCQRFEFSRFPSKNSDIKIFKNKIKAKKYH